MTLHSRDRGRQGPGLAGVAKREDSYGRISGPKAGSRASSPGEQAAACDYRKTRALGRGARRGGGYDAARRQAVAGYLMVAPAMAIFFVFTLLPVAIALFLSFTNYDVFSKMDWIGTANYQDVFEDEFFSRALWNTTTYTVWSIPLSMAIGLGLALVIN